MPLAERVRWAADNGFGSVSFSDDQLVADPPLGVDAEVEGVLSERGIAVTVHPALGPIHSETRRTNFTRGVARAAELHSSTGAVRSIGIDPAWRSVGGDVVYDLEATLRALELIARAFDGLGVAIAIENWKINPEREEFARLARELDGAELGLILDLGHLHVMTDDPVRSARELPLPVREVHVSDNKGDSDDHLPLGRGNLPLADIARVLGEGGFDGIYTFEIRARYNFAECSIEHPAARKVLLDSRRRMEKALSEAKGNRR
ncbi:MAG: sugar phosphate isomerase/epimerase family protein [Planctomycetota bacterium]